MYKKVHKAHGRGPYVAEQLGDTIETVTSTCLHVIDELVGAPPVSAEDAVMVARTRAIIRDTISAAKSVV